MRMPIRNAIPNRDPKTGLAVHVSPPTPLPLTPPPLPVRLRKAGLTAAAVAAFGALLYAKGVPCAFARIFRTPCPGCGSTRSAIALLHGDLDGVLHYNPLGPVMAVFIGVLALQSLASVLVHGDFRGAGEGRVGLVVKRGILVVGALEVALWVARFFGALGGPVPV
jgi:hypothetical protein